jgi:hypothetical protein
MIAKRGRNLRAGQAVQRAGQAVQWDRHWLHGHGLYELSGTIRYQKAA